MKAKGGLSIKTRYFHLRAFKECFVGSAAVTWLTKHDPRSETRPQAVALYSFLVERKIISHVVNEQPFVDGHFFYRFTENATQVGTIKGLLSKKPKSSDKTKENEIKHKEELKFKDDIEKLLKDTDVLLLLDESLVGPETSPRPAKADDCNSS